LSIDALRFNGVGAARASSDGRWGQPSPPRSPPKSRPDPFDFADLDADISAKLNEGSIAVIALRRPSTPCAAACAARVIERVWLGTRVLAR
jgi:hypothetical protein